MSDAASNLREKAKAFRLALNAWIISTARTGGTETDPTLDPVVYARLLGYVEEFDDVASRLARESQPWTS